MSDEMTAILEEFVVEAREHLAGLEPALLTMEQQGDGVSRDTVNAVFRAIHSIKGGVSFLAFSAPKELSHAMESVLTRVRDGHLSITPQVVDVLLRSTDLLRNMIDNLGGSASISYDAELAELELIAHGAESTNSKDAPIQPKAPKNVPLRNATEAEKNEAIAHGRSLFRLELDLPAAPDDEQLSNSILDALRSVSRILAAEKSTLSGVSRLSALCSSALDGPTLAVALGVPPDAVQCVSLSAEQKPGETSPEPPPAAAAKVETDAEGVLSAPAASTGAGSTSAMGSGRDPVATAPDVEPTDPNQIVQRAPDSVVPPSNVALAQREWQPSTEISETLRVRVELLSRLMNTAGELVLGRNQLLRSVKGVTESIPGLTSILQHLDRVTTELQEGVMQTRMQPIATLFGRQQRLVRDLSNKLGKRVRIVTQGDDVELDKSILEALTDPLTHIIRNAIDHGIETPAVRQRQGKSPHGTVLLSAYHEGGQVNIEVSDDGQGIDRAKVVGKAIERRMITQEAAAELSERDAINLVLLPGFSTAENVSEISGRGVGMDVVKTNVERLGGHVEIHTEVGHGTTMRLRLPLTLAIIASLIVQVGSNRFAVPQVNIVELVRIRQAEGPHRIELVHGASVLRLRGRLLPLVHLSDVLGMPSNSRGAHVCADSADEPARQTPGHRNAPMGFEQDEECYVVVLRAGENRYGVIVNELHEWEEIVVKPVPAHLKSIDCFAGTTILGDGCVIMILDAGGLAARSKLLFGSIRREEKKLQSQRDREAKGLVTRSIILFAGAPNEIYAAPQDRVLRLERITQTALRKLGNRNYVQYRGRGLQVVRLDDCYPVSAIAPDEEELYLVIPRSSDNAETAPSAGLLIWKILDALDVDVALEPPIFKGPGVLGCAVVQGELTTFIDPTALFQKCQISEGAE